MRAATTVRRMLTESNTSGNVRIWTQWEQGQKVWFYNGPGGQYQIREGGVGFDPNPVLNEGYFFIDLDAHYVLYRSDGEKWEDIEVASSQPSLEELAKQLAAGNLLASSR